MDVDVDGIAAIGRAELTEEELADREISTAGGKLQGRPLSEQDASWINGAKFSRRSAGKRWRWRRRY